MDARAKELDSWKGRKSKSGLYRIHYGQPLTLREIFRLGMHSSALRLFLCTIVFAAVEVAFSFFAYSVLDFLRGKDLLFLFLGIAVLAASFVIGKKFGRGYAIILKWVGMPMIFIGVLAFGLTRLGLAAFWVAPVDLFLGNTAQTLAADDNAYGAFHALLQGLAGIKGAFLRGDIESSIFTSLMDLYRQIAATMNFYAVVPVLILISMGVFLMTLLLVNLCGIITLVLPVGACYGLTRLLGLLDRKFS